MTDSSDVSLLDLADEGEQYDEERAKEMVEATDISRTVFIHRFKCPDCGQTARGMD